MQVLAETGYLYTTSVLYKIFYYAKLKPKPFPTQST